MPGRKPHEMMPGSLEQSIMDLSADVEIIIGEARLPIENLLTLETGDVIALEKSIDDPVDVYVAGQLMARGQLIISDGKLGVSLTEIIAPDKSF